MTKLGFIFGTLLIYLMILWIGSTYAIWNINIEKVKKVTIQVVTLNYKLEAVGLSSNKITIPAGTIKDIEVTITSLNSVRSKYILYYEGTLPAKVGIGYTDQPGEGVLGTNASTHKIKIRLVNNSSSSYTYTLGMQGGLENKTFNLLSNRNKLLEMVIFTSKEFAYTGSYQEFVVPYEGYYQVELWGASGGVTIGTGLLLGGLVGVTFGKFALGAGSVTAGIAAIVTNAVKLGKKK